MHAQREAKVIPRGVLHDTCTTQSAVLSQSTDDTAMAALFYVCSWHAKRTEATTSGGGTGRLPCEEVWPWGELA